MMYYYALGSYNVYKFQFDLTWRMSDVAVLLIDGLSSEAKTNTR